MAIFKLFEKIAVFQIFLGLFLVGPQSGIKDDFDVQRGWGCGRVGNRNRRGSLAHVEGMRDVCWSKKYWSWYTQRNPLIDKVLRR